MITTTATRSSSLLSDPRFSSFSSSSSSSLHSQKDSLSLSVRRSYICKAGKKNEEATPLHVPPCLASVREDSSSPSLEHRDKLKSDELEEGGEEGKRHQRIVGSIFSPSSSSSLSSSRSSSSSSSCMVRLSLLSSSSSSGISTSSSAQRHSSSTSIQEACRSLRGDLGDDGDIDSPQSSMRHHQEKEHDEGEIKTDLAGQERRDNEPSSISSFCCPPSFSITMGASSHSFISSSSFATTSLLDQSSPLPCTSASSPSSPYIGNRRCLSCDDQRGGCRRYERGGGVIEGRRRKKTGGLRYHRHSFASVHSSSSLNSTSPQSIALYSRERAPHDGVSFVHHDFSPLSLPPLAAAGLTSSSSEANRYPTQTRDQHQQQASQQAQDLPPSSSSSCLSSVIGSPRRSPPEASLSSSISLTDFSKYPASTSTTSSFSSYDSPSVCRDSLPLSALHASLSSSITRPPEKTSSCYRRGGQSSSEPAVNEESLRKLLPIRSGEDPHQKDTFSREKVDVKRRCACPSYPYGCCCESCCSSSRNRRRSPVDTPENSALERRKIPSSSPFPSDQETYTNCDRSDTLLLSEVHASFSQNVLLSKEKGTWLSCSERPLNTSSCRQGDTSKCEFIGEIIARERTDERNEATRDESPLASSSFHPRNCPEGVELDSSHYYSPGLCTPDRSILHRGTTRLPPSHTGGEELDHRESCREALKAQRTASGEEEEAKEVQGGEREIEAVSISFQQNANSPLVPRWPRRRRRESAPLSTEVTSAEVNRTSKKIEGDSRERESKEEEDEQVKDGRANRRRGGVVCIESIVSPNPSVLQTTPREKNVFSSLEQKDNHDGDSRFRGSSPENSFSPASSSLSYERDEEESEEKQRKKVVEKIVREADEAGRPLVELSSSSFSTQSSLSLDGARGAAAVVSCQR